MLSEFWWFVLFFHVAALILGLAIAPLFGISTSERHSQTTETTTLAEVMVAVFIFSLIPPLFSVATRRLHDVGRSGIWLVAPFAWMPIAGILFMRISSEFEQLLGGNSVLFAPIAVLILVVEILLQIFLLFWLLTDSQPVPNKYGPNPHEVTP